MNGPMQAERATDETARYQKQAWLAWERVRIVYNAVLFVQGLTSVYFLWQLDKIADYHYRFGSSWVGFAILFGVVANVFYCLGPLAEACVHRLIGRGMVRARYFLFAVGLLLSMGLILLLARGMWLGMSSHLGPVSTPAPLG